MLVSKVDLWLLARLYAKIITSLMSQSVAPTILPKRSVLHHNISDVWMNVIYTEVVLVKSVFLEWNSMAEFLCGLNEAGEGH